MNTTEIVTFGDETLEFTWIEGGEPSNELVSQVSGYVFNPAHELLIVKSKNWTIPGGHPEAGETYIETLTREIMEESNIEIENITFLGQVKVVNMATKEIKYQLRFIATPSKIHEFNDKFETSERLFIDPKELVNYIPWAKGKVFQSEVNAAVNKIK